MAKLSIKEIVASLKEYTMLDLNELVKEIEAEFGISADFVAASSSGQEESKKDVQSEFALHLVSAGANKISVIKVIRELTGLGLMEAKKMVDSAPVVVKESISSDEVESLKAKFVEAGATVEFK